VTERVLTWRGTAPAPEAARFEQVRVELGLGRIHARGTALAGGPAPYRVDYELDTVADHLTRRLTVRAAGPGWARELRLARDADGTWSARRTADPPDGVDGLADVDLLDQALDCDLTYSPLTNAMPVRRHGLHLGPGQVDLVMAWVQLPGLTVLRNGQRYRHLRLLPGGGAAVRYSSGTFSADLTVDADGFVLEYPELATRV
jgi:hypothetical protein